MTSGSPVQQLVARYGWNSTSFQTLEPGFLYWFAPDNSAVVAYVDTGRAWVAAGEPMAAAEQLPHVVDAFIAAARKNLRRVVFFATEERLKACTPLAATQIGEQPVWRPDSWGQTVQRSRSLREQLRRARAKGITVRAVNAAEMTALGSTQRAVADLIDHWRAARPMAPMGFLVQVEPFDQTSARRIFLAENQAGTLMGFAGVIPVYARNGWFIENLLRRADAPNGTAELLVDAAMHAAAADGSAYLTLGLAPLAGAVHGWLRAAQVWGAGLYDFRGLRAFKGKFRPQRWDPIFISRPPDQNLLLTLFDVLSAFTPRGMLRFAFDTLLRGPAVALRILALLLIPWTAGLYALDTARWFPTPAVQTFWVGFDIVLTACLFILGWRWRPTLATVLAVAITCDALTTLAEAVVFPGPPGVEALFLKVIAVLAPSAAAVLLWSARAHRRRLG